MLFLTRIVIGLPIRILIGLPIRLVIGFYKSVFIRGMGG